MKKYKYIFRQLARGTHRREIVRAWKSEKKGLRVSGHWKSPRDLRGRSQSVVDG